MHTVEPAVCEITCGDESQPVELCKTFNSETGQWSVIVCPPSTDGGSPTDGKITTTTTGCIATSTSSTVTCKTTITAAICDYGGTKGPCPVSGAAATTPSIQTGKPLLTTASTTAPGSHSPTAASGPQGSSSTSTVFQKERPVGISKGAAAGISIGTAILGAAIASFFFVFLFARYKKRRQQPNDYTHHLGNFETSPKKSVVVVAENYLPQPAEDDAIKGELSRLRDNIKNHAQSYYHTAPVSAQAIDQNRLHSISGATGIPTPKLQELFLNPKTRTAAIRLYLAWIILSRCGLQENYSLLPTEVATFAAAMAGGENSSTSETALVSKWKVVSGELLQKRKAQKPSAPDHSIAQVIADADAVLAVFVDPQPNENDKRQRNLEGIVRRAAQFAFLLFSQPSSWSIDWAPGMRGSQFVVFPGLQQTVNEEGSAQRPSRRFSESELV